MEPKFPSSWKNDSKRKPSNPAMLTLDELRKLIEKAREEKRLTTRSVPPSHKPE